MIPILLHIYNLREERTYRKKMKKKRKRPTTCFNQPFQTQLSEEHVKHHLPSSLTAIHIHNKHLQHTMSLRARDFTAVGENIMPMCVLMAKLKNVKVDGK